MQRLTRRVHYVSSAAVGGLLVMWVVTGFAFTCFDFAAVRGTKDRAPGEVLGADALAAMPVLARTLAARPELRVRSVELRSLAGEAVLVVEPTEGNALLVDPKTGALRRALDADDAARIAVAAHRDRPTVGAVESIDREDQEVWVDPPAFRVRLADGRGTEAFVDARTGTIVAWRNEWWRRFDALFSLHTFGFVSRESPAQWPLRLAGLLALLATTSGVAVLGYRVRGTWAALRRRKAISAPSSVRAPS